MDEYPDPDEEFELMYGDELELMREQDDLDVNVIPRQSRKSLDFNQEKPSQSAQYKNKENNSFISNTPTTLNDSFEKGFTPISCEESVSKHNTDSLENSSNLKDNSRKRTVEELFGDIDDILFDNTQENQAKKRKGTQQKDTSEHDEDYALIEQILYMRKLSEQQANPLLVKKNYTTAEDRNKNNLSYSVPKYPFIGVTKHDGQRLYVRFHSEEYEKEEREKMVQEINFSGGLGDVFKNVWDQVNEMFAKNTEASAEITDESMEVDTAIADEKQLWVDLYKPRRYIELLSDESTNRIMLRWMKLWDKIVFNRKPKVKIPKPNERKTFVRQELNTELDEHGRPKYKVALLCGPPGLGKTTLAHMVAKHAGYNPVEINASDDRSTEAFKTAIENSTQMRSCLDQEKRPNCLIFDEIDGAPQASIDLLVKFIMGGKIKSNNKKGKKDNTTILKRPIICICNDVYAPALRPLRQIAFVVNFPPTSTSRLAERLITIAKRQQVKTDMLAMMALAEKSNNDIRSCLSVLQFFKAQNKPVTLSQIYKSSIGQKDMQKGLFSVWQEIFQVNREFIKKHSVDENILKIRMERVLNVVNSFGDYERLAQGVFENYLHLKGKETKIGEIHQALEWFGFMDVINTEIYSTQNYSLSSYLQYAFVVWHFIFGSVGWQKLSYPNQGYEAKLKQTRQRAIITELMRGLQPSIRCYVHASSLITDILPLLIYIITPPFRPVNLHLYNKQEREELARVVNTMIDYNLNYIQERTPEGTYNYRLDPAINEIITFNKKPTNQKILSYANKQMIAQEIEATKMKRFQTENSNKSTKISATKETKKPTNQSTVPNHLQKLTAKTIKPKTEPKSSIGNQTKGANAGVFIRDVPKGTFDNLLPRPGSSVRPLPIPAQPEVPELIPGIVVPSKPEIPELIPGIVVPPKPEIPELIPGIVIPSKPELPELIPGIVVPPKPEIPELIPGIVIPPKPELPELIPGIVIPTKPELPELIPGIVIPEKENPCADDEDEAVQPLPVPEQPEVKPLPVPGIPDIKPVPVPKVPEIRPLPVIPVIPEIPAGLDEQCSKILYETIANIIAGLNKN